MARPAILSAGLLMFIQTISTFEVPQLIGVPGRRFVFVSRIYSALQNFPPDYGTVGVHRHLRAGDRRGRAAGCRSG